MKERFSARIRIGILVFTLMSSLSSAGKTAFIPDSIPLTDLRFFKHKKAAAAIFSTDDMEPGKVKTILYRSIIDAADSIDLSAQAVGCLRLARYYFFRENKPGIALEWVNRCLVLESRLESLSAVRQYLLRDVAGMYTDFNAHRLAAPYFREALMISVIRDSLPTSRVYGLCSDYAIHGFQRNGQKDSALLYFRKAITYAGNLGNYFWTSAAYNNYGMALMEYGQHDSALKIFQKASATLKLLESKDSLFAASIRDNTARALEVFNRNEEALALYENNFSYFKNGKDIHRHLNSGVRSIGTMLRLGKKEQALQRMKEVDQIFAKCSGRTASEAFIMVQECRINLYRIFGKWNEVALLQEELIRFRENKAGEEARLRPEIFENIILEKTASFRKNIELSRMKEEEAVKEAGFTRLLAYQSILLGIIILSFIITFYSRKNVRIKARVKEELYRRELAEMQLRNEELSKERLSGELLQKKRDLTDYALALSQKKKIFDEILGNLTKIKKSGDPGKDVQELIMVLKGRASGEEKLMLEPGDMEKVNHEFFDKLLTICPNLTVAERDLCGLLRLKFSSKEISNLRNIAPASVRISKFRLKKKLGLETEVDLTEFLVKL